MADKTIAATDTGVYEVALVANTPQEVVVNHKAKGRRRAVTIVNGGAVPLYVGRATLAPKAATSIAQVPAGGTKQVNVMSGASLWVVATGTGPYSIYKS